MIGITLCNASMRNIDQNFMGDNEGTHANTTNTNRQALAQSIALSTLAELDTKSEMILNVSSDFKATQEKIKEIAPGIFEKMMHYDTNTCLGTILLYLNLIWSGELLELIISGKYAQITTAINAFLDSANSMHIIIKPNSYWLGDIKDFLVNTNDIIQNTEESIIESFRTLTQLCADNKILQPNSALEEENLANPAFQAVQIIPKEESQDYSNTVKNTVIASASILAGAIASYYAGPAIGATVTTGVGILGYGASNLITRYFTKETSTEVREPTNLSKSQNLPKAVTQSPPVEEGRVVETNSSKGSQEIVSEYFSFIHPELAQFITGAFALPEDVQVSLSEDKKTLTIELQNDVSANVDPTKTVSYDEYRVLNRHDVTDLNTLKNEKQNTKPSKFAAECNAIPVTELQYVGSIGPTITKSIVGQQAAVSIKKRVAFTRDETGVVTVIGGPKEISSFKYIPSNTPGNGAIQANPSSYFLTDKYFLKDLKKLIGFFKLA